MRTAGIRRTAGMHKCKRLVLPVWQKRLKSRIQSEMTVEVEHAKLITGSWHCNVWSQFIIIGVAIRNYNIQSIDSASQQNYDQPLGSSATVCGAIRPAG